MLPLVTAEVNLGPVKYKRCELLTIVIVSVCCGVHEVEITLRHAASCLDDDTVTDSACTVYGVWRECTSIGSRHKVKPYGHSSQKAKKDPRGSPVPECRVCATDEGTSPP